MVFESYRSYVDPEDIELGYDYCFSFDPSDKHQYGKMWGHQRFNHFKEFWYAFTCKFLYSLKYKFYIEKSKRGRLHFHGIISFQKTDEADQFYDFLFRLQHLNMATYCFGRQKEVLDEEVSSEDVETYQTWLQYCKKQFTYMRACGYKPIIKSGDAMVLTKIDTNSKDISAYFKCEIG